MNEIVVLGYHIAFEWLIAGGIFGTVISLIVAARVAVRKRRVI